MQPRALICILSCVVTLAMIAGCASRAKTDASAYETIGKDPRRDSELARQENAQAVALLDAGDYAKAETALRAGLAADVMCGPAHNNLGKAFFPHKKRYPAARGVPHPRKVVPTPARTPNTPRP